MKTPKISVIMSTKDTEKEILQKAVESILNQTFGDFEFLIVCDGSKENYSVLKEYDDKRIKIINHEVSVGLTKSLNELIKISRGKYLARMDSDDISCENRFSMQYEFMEKNQDIHICSTYGKYIGDKSSYMIDPFIKNEEKCVQLLITNRVIHPSIMMRKKFLEQNHILYDEKFIYSQDFELWNRVCQEANLTVIPEIGIYYRVHQNQISVAKEKEQTKLCDNIYSRTLKIFDLENNSKNLNFLRCLDKKKNANIDKNELKNFIETIIAKNNKENLYDKKALKMIFYHRYFASMYCNFKIWELVKYSFKAHLFQIYFKKMRYIIKFKVKNI